MCKDMYIYIYIYICVCVCVCVYKDLFHTEYLIKLNASTVQTSRLETILINLGLFCLFLLYVLYKYWCTLPEDDPQRDETCRSYSALIVTILYYNILRLLVFSWILTVSARI